MDFNTLIFYSIEYYIIFVRERKFYYFLFIPIHITFIIITLKVIILICIRRDRMFTSEIIKK